MTVPARFTDGAGLVKDRYPSGHTLERSEQFQWIAHSSVSVALNGRRCRFTHELRHIQTTPAIPIAAMPSVIALVGMDMTTRSIPEMTNVDDHTSVVEPRAVTR